MSLIFLSVSGCFKVFLGVAECFGVFSDNSYCFFSVTYCFLMLRSVAECYGVGWSIAERCRVFISVGYGFLELPSIACGS